MSFSHKVISSYLKIRGTCGSLFPLSSSWPTFSPNYIQVRYAARKGKRARLLAEKLARKLSESSKPKPPPERFIRKVKQSVHREKTRDKDENWDTNEPIDNIWRTALYRGKAYDFKEALNMHRQIHHPTILNEPEAFIYATVELDLRLKKKNHYLNVVQGVVTYPNEFDCGSKNKVIVLCKAEEDQDKAKDAGALFVGGPALVKQMLSGEIAREEYDYVVCHPDTFKECNSLRGILKKNYPSAINGLLRLDVDRAVTTFSNGVKYQSEYSVLEPDYGWLNVTFGKLNMPDDSLEENFKYMLNTIERHKPQGTNEITFITKTILWCMKTPERIKTSYLKYLPYCIESGVEQEETG